MVFSCHLEEVKEVCSCCVDFDEDFGLTCELDGLVPSSLEGFGLATSTALRSLGVWTLAFYDGDCTLMYSVI